MNITLPVAKSVQGDLVLYSTSIEVKNLVSPGFYSVEKLDPNDEERAGYQRVLNRARAKKLAGYILKGQESRDAFLPTSVLLATDKNIDYDSDGTITICPGEVCPFSVVDGQHRLEGLRMAAETDNRVLEFQVPINIAINLDAISQMCHFLIVNTTQKSVDKAVEQHIYAHLTRLIGLENIPSLPKWIQTIVDRGAIDKAVKITDYLNSTDGSPWYGKIQMANEAANGKTIKQGSFVTLLNKLYLVASNPVIVEELDKQKKVFLNYWKAISEILDDGSDSVLFKYNGVVLFGAFSIPFFNKLKNMRSFTVDTMKDELENCFNSMEGEHAGVGSPEWWHKGSVAGGMNSGAISKVVHEMTKALYNNAGKEIEL
ncbi:MAG: DGQHR domain-containing protein [Gammaproteobacteria bacterium]